MSRMPRAVCFLLLFAVVLAAPRFAAACPFCTAVSMTFTEEMTSADAVVVAQLVERPAPDPNASPTALPPKSRFEITDVIKGAEHVADLKSIEALYFGQGEPGAKFLMIGIDPKNLAWGTPTALTDRGIDYLKKLPSLPESGPDRLAYFQDYFESEDPLLLDDAYNEFAKAPYADVKALKDRMPREKLLGWIRDDKVPANRKRLYLTMLGVCGQSEDIAELETLIRNDDRQTRNALDAMIGCYLNLQGIEGLPLVEELFLRNPKSEYTDTYSAIMALRFHGQETDVIPRDRLVASLRLMLERAELADLVIPDLARWQDWSATDRLVELFKNADEKSGWVRVPVVNFLRASPEPRAKDYIEELAQIDPDAVKRASQFFPLPGGGGPKPAADASPSTTTDGAEDAAVAGDASAAASGAAPTDAAAVGSVQVSNDVAPAEGDADPANVATAGPQFAPAPAGVSATSSARPSVESSLSNNALDGDAASAPTPGEVARPEEPILLAQASQPRPSDAPLTSHGPPLHPSDDSRWMLIGSLAVGVVFLLVLLAIVRGKRGSQVRASS